MRAITQVVVILLFLSSFAAGDQPCARGTIDYINGKWYQSEVYPNDLLATPSWDPTREPQPPLPAGKAIELATTKLGELFPPIADWLVKTVTLNWSYKPGHWYYQIFFVENFLTPNRAERDSEFEGKSFSILVLMDGKVIEPTIRQE